MRVSAIAFGCLLLAGCAATPQQTRELASQVPPAYREIVKEYVRSTFKDPYSIKDARISEPTSVFVGLVNGGHVPGVCVAMNAKNGFGGYTGTKVYSVAFSGSSVMMMHEPINNSCQGVTLSPYPEIENMS